jgi:hypothetical protein
MEQISEQTPDSETQDLIWAMLDEQISEGGFRRLESLLSADEEARRLYVQCVQLHVDLQQWFGPKEDAVYRGSLGLPLDLPQTNGDASLADEAF